MFRRGLKPILLASLVLGLVAPRLALGQLPEPGDAGAHAPNPMSDSTVTPAKMVLFSLELRFAKDVADRGGAAFGDWFAEDGVMLNNGAAPVMGRAAVMKVANWSPKDYQLSWTPSDVQMGPSGDIGYTWGHFEGHSKDANGNPVTTTGRYITIWKKQIDGLWKVELDAGSNEPAGSGDCCKVPTGN